MMLSSRFDEAFSYAAALHAQQRRKLSGEPYLAHLLSVAALVMEHGGNEDEAIAALLHDAVEDQGGLPTLEEIRRRFGQTVADIVEGCTDAVDSPKPPWRPRKEAYLARLQKASPSVRLVSAADKLHNARAILREYRRAGESLWSHFRGGREGTLWYYRAAVETLKTAAVDSPPVVDPLVEEVDRTVTEIERLANFCS
jgi:(p)ppGpp synthase/HD superfamily hydrolase